MKPSEYVPRLTKPEKGNKYYNTKSNGGYSTAIVGKPTDKDCNVLSNCVGWAVSRYHEVAKDPTFSLVDPVNAENIYQSAINHGRQVSQTPSLGAIMVWQKGATLSGSDGAGHVAIVEKIYSATQVLTSESGYNCSNPFWTQVRNKGNDGNWGGGTGYKFLGFVKNPAVEDEPKCPYKAPSRVLKFGMNGEDVMWMQWQLKERGYICGCERNKVDGDFGLFTLEALLGFQFQNKLGVDGICGPATQKALGK